MSRLPIAVSKYQKNTAGILQKRKMGSHGGCQPRIEVIVKLQKQSRGRREVTVDWWMSSKNRCYCENKIKLGERVWSGVGWVGLNQELKLLSKCKHVGDPVGGRGRVEGVGWIDVNQELKL